MQSSDPESCLDGLYYNVNDEGYENDDNSDGCSLLGLQFFKNNVVF